MKKLYNGATYEDYLEPGFAGPLLVRVLEEIRDAIKPKAPNLESITIGARIKWGTTVVLLTGINYDSINNAYSLDFTGVGGPDIPANAKQVE